MDNKIIPNHLQIETVNGVCTAKCTICTWPSWSRKPGRMDNSTYARILEKFKPYTTHIKYVTLHGCGEPLLDKDLAWKIRLAKEMGFSGTGFATNCTELDEGTSRELIKAGLDTIICSIDGVKKDTHEAIRRGTDFEKVVSNVKRFVQIRNNEGKTRVLVRFISQKINKDEEAQFFDYWGGQLNGGFGDKVIKFDLHNWGDQLKDYDFKDPNVDVVLEKCVCQDIFERILIYSNCDIGFCCADDNGFFKLGNALESDPIELFNGEKFRYYRQMMIDGKIKELEHCKTCSMPRSRALKAD